MNFFKFEGKQKGASENEKRKQLTVEIFELVKDLDYLNKDSVESLGEANQFGTLPSSEELQGLKNLIEGSKKEELPEVLDNWLIDHESLILMMMPGEASNDDESEAIINDYKEKMRRAKSVVGGWFQKDKLDLLYSDTGGGAAFDEKITELEASLNGLSPEDKSIVLHKFIEDLRG